MVSFFFFFSFQTDPLPSVSVVPSSIISMNALIPPGQMSAMHSYVMDPQGVPQSVASTNSLIPQSHMGHFQSMPLVPPHQLWQNHQVLVAQNFKAFVFVFTMPLSTLICISFLF